VVEGRAGRAPQGRDRYRVSESGSDWDTPAGAAAARGVPLKLLPLGPMQSWNRTLWE